ncbi:hypothetical protein ESZ54_04985 [Vagococcus silagei]|uniref:Uncharacterized protein n=1 Tax=Vagococcus silagei TaxID=2508885 RepID=A0A4S3B2N5_9ENTE|nr:hypothetical protein [Vagococcus silagei]THB61404.1 hypothetical protein ESZ54_04985 [Vagococcus silagei]
MTVEIKSNNDNTITIKNLSSEQLQVFNNIFGNPMTNMNNLVNQNNQQYTAPVTINGDIYAYSVYDAPNYGKNTYTIDIQMLGN